MRTRPRLDRRQQLGIALAHFTWRRLFVRLVGLLTCLVGLAGVAASAYGYQQVERAEVAAQQQLLQIAGTFDQIAASMRTASTTAANAGNSADGAKTSLAGASAAARGAADALDETAKVINFTIPFSNLRPLAGVDVSFRDQARQLRALGDQVDQTGGLLTQNGQDLRTIGADVARVADDMGAVSGQVRQFAGAGPGPGALTQITNSTRLLISWSVIIHLLLFGMGLSQVLLTTNLRYSIEPSPARQDRFDNEEDYY
jgi:hypothetical protein